MSEPMTARLGCTAYGDRAREPSRRNGRGNRGYVSNRVVPFRYFTRTAYGGTNSTTPCHGWVTTGLDRTPRGDQLSSKKAEAAITLTGSGSGSGRRRLVDGVQAAVGEGEVLRVRRFSRSAAGPLRRRQSFFPGGKLLSRRAGFGEDQRREDESSLKEKGLSNLWRIAHLYRALPRPFRRESSRALSS
ncbi:hypothetical protein DPX16_19774 [Anabarilius grahami]|uniref:Uncharacterized protein n=1 Tax=Anabarilius grahami TaxID=495550 RepID=A0A3N0XQ69_ANAGA|nr:hypothetical protein DPX16_19774 [Anabarilius grahami]